MRIFVFLNILQNRWLKVSMRLGYRFHLFLQEIMSHARNHYEAGSSSSLRHLFFSEVRFNNAGYSKETLKLPHVLASLNNSVLHFLNENFGEKF
jgi:hypothetical protein